MNRDQILTSLKFDSGLAFSKATENALTVDDDAFLADVINIVVARVQHDGLGVDRSQMARLIARCPSASLYNHFKSDFVRSPDYLITLINSHYPDITIEKSLIRFLWDYHLHEGQPWRSYIAEALQEHGTRESLDVLKAIRSNIAPSVTVWELRPTPTRIECTELNARRDFLQRIQDAIEAIENRPESTSLHAPYLSIRDEEIGRIIDALEGERCEFKEVWNQAKDRILQTITAFLNSQGGHLFIGIDNRGAPNPRLWDGEYNPDTLMKHLSDVISQKIGTGYSTNIRMRPVIYREHRIIVVEIDMINKSLPPAYLKEGGVGSLYERLGTSNRKLDAPGVATFLRNRDAMAARATESKV